MSKRTLDFSVTFHNGFPRFSLVGFQFLSRPIDIYIPAPRIIPAVVPRANIKQSATWLCHQPRSRNPSVGNFFFRKGCNKLSAAACRLVNITC